ncbi:unnamed protein product [Brassica oleracea]
MSKVSPYLLRERALEEQVVSSFKHRRTETASCCRCNVPVGNSVAFWKSILDSYPSHELVFWSVELKPDTSVPFDLWVSCSNYRWPLCVFSFCESSPPSPLYHLVESPYLLYLEFFQ